MTNLHAGVVKQPLLRRNVQTLRPFSRLSLRLESLEQRCTPVITSDVTAGVLTVTSDAEADAMVIGVDAGNVTINGANPDSGPVNADSISRIMISGGDGNDTIDLSEVTSLSYTALLGTELNGDAGIDLIIGSELNDILRGGSANDTLIGFVGSDELFGDADDDLFIWNHGDGTDLFEGGTGNDQVIVNGSMTTDDELTIESMAMRVNLQRTNLEPFSLDLGTVERLLVNTFGGDDRVDATGLEAGVLNEVTLNGEQGDDSLVGSAGADSLNGGGGNDTLIGFQNNDTLVGAEGNDLLIWNNGDGTDLLEGGAGTDTVEVNSASDGDELTIADAGTERVRVERTNVGPFSLDIGSSEVLEVNGQAGDDTITATGLSAGRLELDVNGDDGADFIIGSAGGDLLQGGADSDSVFGSTGNDTILGNSGNDTLAGEAGNDLLIWNNGDGNDQLAGEDGDDTVQVTGSNIAGDDVQVTGSGTTTIFERLNLGVFRLEITTSEILEVNLLAGDDTINASGLPAGLFDEVIVDGGAGNDSQVGSQGPDTLVGGEGADTLLGFQGNDNLQGQNGDDVLVWNNGDGDDTVGGGPGNDIAQINGADGSDEDFMSLLNGDRIRFERTNFDPFVLDIGTSETIAINALGGDDSLMVMPLESTDFLVNGGDGIDRLDVNLAGASNPMQTGPTDGMGRITFDDREPITFGGMEQVNVFEGPPPPTGQNTTDRFAVGAEALGGNSVQVIDGDGNNLYLLPAFEETLTGGVRTALADITGDGVPDVIVGSGPGQTAQVRLFDGATEQPIGSPIIPFETTYTGGLFVAAGDVNDDGRADIVVSPDVSGGPRVQIYDAATLTILADFFGIEGDVSFRGGVRVGMGDLNADGFSDLLVAAGASGGPRVAVFDGQAIGNGTPGAKLVTDFFVFEPSLRDGVFLSAGDFNGDGQADLVVGGGPQGGPRVRIFSGAALLAGNFDPSDPGVTPGVQLANFFVGDPASRGGIRLTVKDLNQDGRADLVAGAGEGIGSEVTGFLGETIPTEGSPSDTRFGFPVFADFLGGVFVG